MHFLPVVDRRAASPRRTRVLARVLSVCGVLVWLGAIGLGVAKVLEYEWTPGALGRGLEHPGEIGAGWENSTATLVVALHPECPCSRATVEAIDRLVAALPGRLAVHAVFLDVAAGGRRPQDSALWQRIGRIPGARAHVDASGLWCGGEAFKTSGEVCVFSAEGKLLFHGGVTASRGHEGPSRGAEAIVAALREAGPQLASVARAPVFGCGLEDPSGEGLGDS